MDLETLQSPHITQDLNKTKKTAKVSALLCLIRTPFPDRHSEERWNGEEWDWQPLL